LYLTGIDLHLFGIIQLHSLLIRKDGKIMVSDTTPEAEKILIEGYRKMTPQQKMKIVSDMTITVQQFALARIRKQYPDASEREQQLRLASLWLDRETMIRLFDWDPEKEGY
jgi:hypothetical protein